MLSSRQKIANDYDRKKRKKIIEGVKGEKFDVFSLDKILEIQSNPIKQNEKLILLMHVFLSDIGFHRWELSYPSQNYYSEPPKSGYKAQQDPERYLSSELPWYIRKELYDLLVCAISKTIDPKGTNDLRIQLLKELRPIWLYF